MDSSQPLCERTDRMLTMRNQTPLKRQRFYVYVCPCVCATATEEEKDAEICRDMYDSQDPFNICVFFLKHNETSHTCTKWQ